MSAASTPKVIVATFVVERVFRVPQGLNLDTDSWYVKGDRLLYKRSTDDVWQTSSDYEVFGDFGDRGRKAEARIDNAGDWGMEDDTDDDDDDDEDDDDVKDESEETAKDKDNS